MAKKHPDAEHVVPDGVPDPTIAPPPPEPPPPHISAGPAPVFLDGPLKETWPPPTGTEYYSNDTLYVPTPTAAYIYKLVDPSLGVNTWSVNRTEPVYAAPVNVGKPETKAEPKAKAEPFGGKDLTIGPKG